MKNTLSILPLLVMVATATAADRPKNIVLILADDLGWADTTLYGKTTLYETPNIERLAARGMTFSSAYASPICSPTRASIMTGQNPARFGMTAPAAHLEDERFKAVASQSGPPHQKCTNVRSATRLDPSMPTLGRLLKDAGYATAHFGKWHLGREPHSPLERGFDVDIPHWWGPGPKSSYLAPWGYANPNFKEGAPGEHIEDRMAKEAVTWLKNREKSKPFFMNYWQFSVHAPFGARPELIDRYRKKLGDSVDGLSKPEVRDKLLTSHQPGTGLPQHSPTYAAMVHSLDDAVGSLLDALDAEGIADETVVVFYSDNGGNIHCGLEETDAAGEKYIAAITSNHPLRGGKGGIHEGGVRVPAVVVWPGVTKPGSRSDVRIQSSDLFPTILRMLNIKQPQDHPVDGVDFAKALRGEEMDRGPIFTHVPGHGNTPQWLPPSMSVHHEDWKLIRTFYYGENGNHEYRLYNLREDIGENNNLAADYPEKVKSLDQLIEDYIAETEVVVPLPNPNFDPAKFDRSKIGVQAGGLKMPPGYQASNQKPAAAKPATTVNRKFLLGWTARSAEAAVEGDSLRITSTGRQPFLANAKVRANGPVEVRLQLRSQKNGVARFQWRTEGQDRFPETGQRKSFNIVGGDWQELNVPLDVKGRLVHLRFFLPDPKRPTEIDWIEIGSVGESDEDSKRWDFKRPAEKEPALETSKAYRPNVLFILVDDMGWRDLACYGHEIHETPNIDALAARGMRFTNAYAACPICAPSRAAIMTGKFPSRTGFVDNFASELNGKTLQRAKDRQFLKLEEVTLAEAFKAGGYQTGFLGKWHLSKGMEPRLPTDQGFDINVAGSFWGHPLKGYFSPYQMPNLKDGPQGEYLTDRLTTEAIGVMDNFSKRDKPWLISMHYYTVHGPLQSKPEKTRKYAEKARQAKVKLKSPAYAGMVESLDENVGRMLDWLDEKGLRKDTIVIVTSDNGGMVRATDNRPLRSYKGDIYEGGIRVPCIIDWSGVIKPGTVSDTPIHGADFYATLLAMTDLPQQPENHEDSVNLVPLLKGDTDFERGPLVWHYPVGVPHIAHSKPGSVIREGDWKYLRFYEDGREELYNLESDIGESNNLFASMPEKAAELKGQLDAVLEAHSAAVPIAVPAKPSPRESEKRANSTTAS